MKRRHTTEKVSSNFLSPKADGMPKIDTSYVERVSRVVGILEGKWTTQILCAMRDRPIRMGSLRRAIPAASKKALTASLRRLEAEGFVLRRDMSAAILPVEYEITENMRGPITALLDGLSEWARAHWDTDTSIAHRNRVVNKRAVD
jgi:DNA-binding HxlR family transcriptional regulator